jgi:hypothetical protein
MTFPTGVSVVSALIKAIATEDTLWDSEIPGSPISPAQHLSSVPSTPRASPPASTSDLPPETVACNPPLASPPPSMLALRPYSTPPSLRPRRAVSIEPLSDLSFAGLDPGVFDRAWGGSPPGPNVAGGQKRKRPLTESGKTARRERHKKQRATEAGKAKKHEKRKLQKSNKLPTEREPQFPKDRGLPQPIPSNIKPLSHFPTVSTGYTGDKNVEPILKKQIWTLEMLVERGLEVFEWDGR